MSLGCQPVSVSVRMCAFCQTLVDNVVKVTDDRLGFDVRWSAAMSWGNVGESLGAWGVFTLQRALSV